MKRNIAVSIAVAVLLTLAFGVSCVPAGKVVKARKTIVVTYAILGSVVTDLVDGKADVVISIPNGLDPHEWEPSAQDIEKLNNADLVVQNGLGLEGGMEKTLTTARSNGVKFFTASDYISIRHVGTGEGIPSGDPDQAIGAPDPHLWMDPLAMKSVIAALSTELKSDFGLDVADRAADLESQLDALNDQVADTLSVIPQQDRKLVTGHESMGYFAQRYGFKLVGVIVPSLSSQAEVSAADLAALKKAVQDNHVKAIFTELGTSPAVAKAIGDEMGVKVVQLTTHALPPDGSYFTFMNNIASTISDALR
ncbi:MAG: metal ABC transporter substrate-binding protein [Dehalococcoidia bacterium]